MGLWKLYGRSFPSCEVVAVVSLELDQGNRLKTGQMHRPSAHTDWLGDSVDREEHELSGIIKCNWGRKLSSWKSNWMVLLINMVCSCNYCGFPHMRVWTRAASIFENLFPQSLLRTGFSKTLGCAERAAFQLLRLWIVRIEFELLTLIWSKIDFSLDNAFFASLKRVESSAIFLFFSCRYSWAVEQRLQITGLLFVPSDGDDSFWRLFRCLKMLGLNTIASWEINCAHARTSWQSPLWILSLA